MSVTTEQFLDLLENVRQVGPDRWMAKCPAHEDKTASLSIRAAEDGRTLVHDFGMECDVGSICAAVGLRVFDLMPPNVGRPYMRPEERGTNLTNARAGDILEVLDYASGVIWLCAVQLMKDKCELSAKDWDELTAARRAISTARALIRPAKLPKERRK